MRFAWRERPRLFNNPVILREMVSRMRQRSSFWQMGLFVTVSAVAFCILWESVTQQMENRAMNGNDSRELFLILNFTLSSMALLLVPLHSASAISLERERESWDLLLTTHLSLGSIILGKMLSAFAFIFLLSVTTLPLYGMLFPLGGVGPEEIVFAFGMVFEITFMVSVLGVFCSAVSRRTLHSISATYVLAFLLIFGTIVLAVLLHEINGGLDELCTTIFAISPVYPIGMFVEGGRGPFGASNFFVTQHPFLTHGLLNAAIAAFLIVFTARWLSQKEHRGDSISWIDNPLGWLKARLGGSRRKAKPGRIRAMPTGSALIALKERRQIRGRYWFPHIGAAGMMLGLDVVVLLFSTAHSGSPQQVADVTTELGLPLAALLVPFLVIPFGCNAIRGERDRDTWDLLLTTTLKPEQVLWGKIRAGVRLFLVRFGFYLPLIFLFGPMMYPGHIAEFWLTIYICVLAAIFYLWFSVCVSAYTRKTISTYGICFAAAVALYALVPLLIVATMARGGPDDLSVFLISAISPWLSVMFFVAGPSNRDLMFPELILCQLCWMTLASVIFYQLSLRRIETLYEMRDG